ncbi:hypothetical protein ElyMa_000565000 [Elysia marginata]|uniref:Uncharacterized protein n=1 Tax=Elysia marginata TaxID=1093978 RepID=A0AAV4G2P2_9GAST|nr:hypothetical protein ElyMa_000565000 [Elysia marginata]
MIVFGVTLALNPLPVYITLYRESIHNRTANRLSVTPAYWDHMKRPIPPSFLPNLPSFPPTPILPALPPPLYSHARIFQGWKIPNRLVPEQIPDGRNEAALAAVYSGKRDRGAGRPQLDRAATLPAIPTSRERHLGVSTPRATPQPVPLVRSKTVLDRASVSTKDCLRDSLQPHAVTLAGDWLKTAPKADRKVIERVLRMQEKKHQLDNALKKSLQPDARRSVEDWLETANDSERQVALKFFSSLAGAKLMGSTLEEQKGRLQQVLRTLEGTRGGVAGPSVHRSLDSPVTQESRLKYVQLLDPHTRANRWMHTTWHHLPEYKNDNPVNNWSSHYVKPHAPTPRHFVIHPDWG